MKYGLLFVQLIDYNADILEQAPQGVVHFLICTFGITDCTLLDNVQDVLQPVELAALLDLQDLHLLDCSFVLVLGS